MKKTYIAPALELMQTEVQQMLAGSITGVSVAGNTEAFEFGGDDDGTHEADVKGNFFGGSIFDE